MWKVQSQHCTDRATAYRRTDGQTECHFTRFEVLVCDAVTGQVIGDVSKDHNAFTFRVKQSKICKHMTIQNTFMQHSPS